MSTHLTPIDGRAQLVRRLRNRLVRRGERGMATAEYAVGTIAAVALVTVLIKIFRNEEFAEVLLQLIIGIFKAVMSAKALGV